MRIKDETTIERERLTIDKGTLTIPLVWTPALLVGVAVISVSVWWLVVKLREVSRLRTNREEAAYGATAAPNVHNTTNIYTTPANDHGEVYSQSRMYPAVIPLAQNPVVQDTQGGIVYGHIGFPPTGHLYDEVRHLDV